MKSSATSLRVALGLAFTACAASAQAVFTENFQSYTITPPATFVTLPQSNTDTSVRWLSRTIDTNRLVRVYTDTSELFGAGASNQYLRLERLSGATADLNAITQPTSTPLLSGEINFDFFVAAGSITSTNNASGFRLTFLANTSTNINTFTSANTVGGIYFTDGTINLRSSGAAMLTDNASKFSFTTDQKNSLRIVFNNTTSTLVYDGGSLSAGFMDIYLNGTKQATWSLNSGNTAGQGNGVNSMWWAAPSGLSNSSHVQGVFNVDNIVLSPAAIPEPATVAFVLPAALGGLFLRRRRAQSR